MTNWNTRTEVFLTTVHYYWDPETGETFIDTDFMFDEFRAKLVKLGAIEKDSYLAVCNDETDDLFENLLD